MALRSHRRSFAKDFQPPFRPTTATRSQRLRTTSGKRANRRLSPAAAANRAKFLSEIGWREFSYSILFHLPTLATVNVRRDFDAFPWGSPDPDVLEGTLVSANGLRYDLRQGIPSFVPKETLDEQTVRSFDEVLSGKCDDLPEQAFAMTGTIDDVRASAAEMAKKSN